MFPVCSMQKRLPSPLLNLLLAKQHHYFKAFALLIALFLAIVLPAQPASKAVLKEKLNRLQQPSHYLQDTAYLNALNELAFVYADSYPDSAISLLNGQAARCHRLGYTSGEVAALKILGNAYLTKGDFATSLKYYQQSFALAKKEKDFAALPGIQNNIGLIYLSQGNYSPALREFYAALKAAEINQDLFVVGSVLNNIATIHFFQNKMEDAKGDYRRMLFIATGRQDTASMIMAYNNIGEINLEQDSAATALRNLQTARQLALAGKRCRNAGGKL